MSDEKKETTVEPLTSHTKDDKHDIYCSSCRVWYSKGKRGWCPTCGRSLLNG